MNILQVNNLDDDEKSLFEYKLICFIAHLSEKLD